MLIKKEDYTMDVDVEKTKEYYHQNSLCDCSSCRNFYAQAKEKLRTLDEFLREFGVCVERPDEIGCVELEDMEHYIEVSYTVCGKILEYNKFEIDLNDADSVLNIVIDDRYVPSEQKDEYFVITVYNILLPWVLDESFPQMPKNTLWDKIKTFFTKNHN